ncbi:hypothetical protein LOW49_004471, partial [Salmonella enterica subsp. enterica serovar Enteritidis]|nr:hypothetical protein [Salmonella enterica subsp. enterica serovar Enteritidis]
MVRCRNQPDLYHQHYDLLQRKYITKDPIGLEGGLNLYQYPLNPILNIDPLGLSGWDSLGYGGFREICQQAGSAVHYLTPQEAAGVIH